ncbi:MAG: hypothetical protein IPO64_13695 [Bacteroidetes bacterium]|nr:hypothetical protein [Bacteroidota bacterium]
MIPQQKSNVLPLFYNIKKWQEYDELSNNGLWLFNKSVFGKTFTANNGDLAQTNMGAIAGVKNKLSF